MNFTSITQWLVLLCLLFPVSYEPTALSSLPRENVTHLSIHRKPNPHFSGKTTPQGHGLCSGTQTLPMDTATDWGYNRRSGPRPPPRATASAQGYDHRPGPQPPPRDTATALRIWAEGAECGGWPSSEGGVLLRGDWKWSRPASHSKMLVLLPRGCRDKLRWWSPIPGPVSLHCQGA